MLKKFNAGKSIDPKLKTKIEKFFAYKWKNDKLQAIDDDYEKAILM